MVTNVYPISAAFFCPRARRPRHDYVTKLRSFLDQRPYAYELLDHVSRLHDAWPLFAEARSDIRNLLNSQQNLNLLVAWSKGGPVGPVCDTSAGLVALPLLLVLQLGQYLRYLDVHNMSHEVFLRHVQHAGGIHGFCGGAAAALCIACAKDEAEVIENAAVFLPVMMGLGAAMDAAGDWEPDAPTTIAVRLRYEGQGEELLGQFPGAYISAVTEPKSISIVGPPQILAKVAVRTKELGLPTHITDITGKSHNPENTDLAKEMIILLSQHPELQLPSSAILRTTIRSNIHGNKLDRESVMEDMVTMMLASRCEWHNLVCRVAEDLKASKQPTHGLVVFGMDDCVPLSPFHKLQVKVSKFEVRSLSFEDEPGESKQKAMPASPNLPGTSIAIVGASCRLPGANDLEEIWQLVSEQRDCLQRCPRDRFNTDESFRVSQSGAPSWMKNLHGNFIDVLRFDHSFFGINAKEAANMDPQQRLLLELSYEALDASGYLATHVRERGDAVGCFVGASMVEYLDNTNAHPPTAYTSTGTIRGFLCGKLSYYYGWTGPSEVIDTACSSSLVAIHRACTALLMGECKIALAGGVNAMTGINNFLDLGKAGFLSPTGQCKAFDVSADGYCRAEGAGLVVLKTLKQAMADGDDILGIIPGIATNQGGLSTTMTVPSSQALQSLYQRLLVKAGLSPSQVSYVEAHATGTQAGDPIEMESIRAVFSDSSRSVPLSIGSIKGNIGHCETAAGVAGLLKVLAMIRHKAIPPQANYRVLNPKIPALDQDGLTIPRHVVTWDAPVRTALVNSYGAAGSNCALLCSEMVKETASMSEVIVRKQGLNIPMILSAASVKSLISYSHKIAEYLSHQKSEAMLVDVAFTLNHRRKNHKFCLEIKDTRLEDVVQSFGAASVASFEWPNKPRPVVLVFGGQNDNKISINRAFVDAYPAFRSHLDSCDSALIKAEHLSLYPGIFQDLPDSGVIVQQCSLFAIQYACARCWIDAGLEIGGIVGHSLGEYAALVISGVLSLADGMKLVASRATLIDIEWGEDKGGMLAILATSSQVDRLLEQVRVQSISRDESLVIACYNALRSTVVSGSSASIDLAEQLLVSDAEFAGIRYQRLSTTHAFHSPLVEPILYKLDGIAATLEYSQPELPLEFCTTDAIHSVHQWSASKHAREPVYFHKAVHRIEQRLGSCVWLEAGVDTCAIPLVRKATLNDVAHSYHHIDTKTRSEPCNTIGDTISAFWRHGISLTHWIFLDTLPKQVWLPPYQFEKSSHGIENIDRAMEAHKKLSQGTTVASESARPLPRQLVKHVETTTNQSTFLIDSQCERYSKVVGGHAVVGYPLCPASMYMECVVMAVQSLSGESDNQDLLFEDVEFSAPLGLSPDREVTIQIVKTSENLAWTFTIHSTLLGSTSTATLHCAGKVTFSKKTSLASFARLLGEPQERLLGSESAEKLKRARAYSLFSKVVHYETFLQGISSVIIDNNEALATVQLAANQPGQDESTAWRRCDAPLLDGFISVAGLLLNSSDLVSSEHVMVAGAVEHTIVTASCTATNLGPWQVYAKYISDGARIVSDVFVYDSQQKVVAMFGGVRFTKVQLSQLRKTLSSLGGTQSAHQVKSRDVHSAPSSVPSESVGTTIHTPDTDIDSAPQPLQRNNSSNPKGNKEGHFRKILSDYIGMDDKDIPSDVVLIDLGVDSLSSLELASDIATRFGLVVDSFDLQQMTLTIILAQIDGTLPIVVDRPSAEVRETDASPEVSLQHPTTVTSTSHHCASEPIAFRRPFEALTEAEAHFDQIALAHGYTDYWSKVAPLQSELLIAYILEAFLVLGVDIASIPLGEPIPPIKHLPKHELLMKRLWEILQDARIVHLPSDTPVKGPSMPSAKTSWDLDRDFLQKYPRYSSEARLMKITGERLADCLQGRQDPVALMFGSEASSEAMEEYYHQSPMLSTSTDMLVTYVLTLLRSVNTTRDHPLRILEAGAGTGGTTTKLAEALSKAGITCEYTFTDISPVLVAKAKSKFAKYPWMSFTTLNLEEEMRHDFRSRYHIVISTNCVHATRSRATSCCRLKDALAEQGILILSEVTQTIEWYDLCFGLLDGWWLAGNGTEYPLQPARVWMDALSESCFASFGYSKGLSRESTTQQLLVGVTRGLNTSHSLDPSELDFHIETMEFKNVDGISILADMYIPHTRSRSLPIALMMHGGGHMTLSRKYVRPAQTRHLLAHGFLPVSLDFRLCPEVNLIEGPITDICDGYRWVREKMPQELSKLGVAVDAEKVVAIGWSTGGHLALSLAWTTLAAGLPPPSAILSFYAPVNFDSAEIYRDCGTTLSRPSNSVQEISKTLPRMPITTYTPTKADENNRFWLQPGDVRSDLLISIFKDNMGLPLFLNGLPKDPKSTEFEMPSEDRIAMIDPLDHLRRGQYTTPTCVVHPTKDNIAPYSAALRFVDEMKARGVRHKFISPDGVGHAFDVNLQQGEDEWEQYVKPAYEFLFESV